MCAKGTVPSFVKLQVITFMFVAAGCTPLQQAPLVYTSSQVIGVKLAVAPTQPESIEAIIGYRDIDAAYAPVAVSNPRPANATHINNSYDKDLYEIKEIYGIYGTQASATNASQLLTQQESADMQVYLQLSQAKYSSDAVAVNDKKILESAERAKILADQFIKEIIINECVGFEPLWGLESIYNGISKCSTPEALVQIRSKYSAMSLLKENQDFINKAEEAARANSAVSEGKYQADLNRFNEIEGKVKRALDKLASIQKRDAISVYGSFDGDTGAEASAGASKPTATGTGDNGVKVKVGKVFATGVAAQNISEAQKISASAVTVSACINVLTDHAIKVYSPVGGSDPLVSSRQQYIKNLIPACFKTKSD